MAEQTTTKKSGVENKKIPASTNKKIIDLKIELLKNPTKRGRIKKEIARLLTMENLTKSEKKS